jgi:hypothetical protein
MRIFPDDLHRSSAAYARSSHLAMKMLDSSRYHTKVALRTNVIEWSAILATMPIPFADVPDIGDNGMPARDQTDPCYQRPLVNHRDFHIPSQS